MSRSLLLALALLVAMVVIGLRAETGKGGVWDNHESTGRTLWSGELPGDPAYPMWGYSLVAGPLGTSVVVLQIALLLGALVWWLPALTRAAADRFGITRWLGNPALLIVLLAPWIWLSISFFSSSLSGLLAWLGSWSLLEAVRQRAPTAWFAVAGGVLGLAANVRTEILLLTGLLALGLGMHAGLQGNWRLGGIRTTAILGGTLFVMLPWLVYTHQTLGSPRLTSTNGGGVMYHGLGILPDNPWGVESDDLFVHEVAEAKVGTRAWSLPANDLFRQMFREAVTSHPAAFARRVVRGWRLALTQGVILPPIKPLVADSEEDLRLADYLNERLKSRLGLAVNRRQLAGYEREGISLDDLSARHYTLVATDYVARAVFVALFLALLLASGITVWRLGTRAPVTWVWLAYVGTWLFTAGLVQTLPRHTTMLLPVLVTAVVLEVAGDRKNLGAVC